MRCFGIRRRRRCAVVVLICREKIQNILVERVYKLFAFSPQIVFSQSTKLLQTTSFYVFCGRVQNEN